MMSMLKRSEDSLMGIVLTGMGRDGADGINYLHSLGAVTIAQDPSTAPIKSMPQAAIETGQVDLILTPDQIRDAIVSF
jgi:two-component system chemotaxis response regulator CheB